MQLHQHTLMSPQHTTLLMPPLMTTLELTLDTAKLVMDMLPLEATTLPFPMAGSKLSPTVSMMLMVDISLMSNTPVKPITNPTSQLLTSLPLLLTTLLLPHTTVRLP